MMHISGALGESLRRAQAGLSEPTLRIGSPIGGVLSKGTYHFLQNIPKSRGYIIYAIGSRRTTRKDERGSRSD